MRTTLDVSRFQHLKRAGVLLIALALVAGISGCAPADPDPDPDPAAEYDLTVSSTTGGSVTTPGEGTLTYYEDTVVELVATPDSDYEFINWTGDVGTVDDVNDASTTITMEGNYSITANFAVIQEIWDWHDLAAIRDALGSYCLLMTDLDSTTAGYEDLAGPDANDGKGWEPIGRVVVISFMYGASGLFIYADSPFEGIFDGQGYEIRDLYVNRPGEAGVGLFGWMEGVIQTVGVVDANVTGGTGVGSLVGYSGYGSVSNSYATGGVTGRSVVGGLLGLHRAAASNSLFTGSVIGDELVGGLVAVNYGGTVSESHSSGNVTGKKWVGGLVGHTGPGFGLIFDPDDGVVSASSSTSTVTGEQYVGGLVGESRGSIENSCSIGSVTGMSEVGGLVGYNLRPINNSYSSGSVTGDEDVGGLVGWNKGTVGNSFWDMETSGIDVSDGGTGKTTAEMMDIATFTDTDTEGLDEPWDMSAIADPDQRNPGYIWNIVDGQTYPFLGWEPQSSPATGAASTVWSLDDSCAKEAPDLICPADGFVIPANPSPDLCENLPFTIRWDHDCDECKYDIQIALDEDFTELTEASHSLYEPPEEGDKSYLVEGGELLCNTTYYWRIRSVEIENGEESRSCWSESWMFVVGPAPGTGVYLITPEAGATDVAITDIVFSWSVGTDVDTYNWVLSPNADLSAPVDSRTGLTATALNVTNHLYVGELNYDTVYYWRVTAIKDGVLIDHALGTFRTVAGIDLIAPEADATDVPTTNIDFTWSMAAVADEFVWELSRDAAFTMTIATATGLTDTGYSYTGTLEYDTAYYWMVTAIKDGVPIDHAVSSFTTETEEITPPPGRCFIATAAYGTPMAEEIEILREFRGGYLLANRPGQALVDFYHRASPPIAEFIEDHPVLKPIVRAALMPAVAMSTVVVDTTPAEKMAVVGLLLLVSVAMALWATRRRGRGAEHARG